MFDLLELLVMTLLVGMGCKNSTRSRVFFISHTRTQ